MSEKQPTYNQWNEQLKYGYPSVLVPRRTGEIQVGQIKSADEDGKFVVTSEKVDPNTKEVERSEWHVHPEALSDQVQERLAGKLAEDVADEYQESRDFEPRSTASELGSEALEQSGIETPSTEEDSDDRYEGLFTKDDAPYDPKDTERAAVRTEPTEVELLRRQQTAADQAYNLARQSGASDEEAAASARRARGDS